MALATKNGSLIVKDGVLAERCECCDEGACCNGETCSVKPQDQCQGAGNTFKGVGTKCSPNPCCQGANQGLGKCDAGLQPATIYIRFQGTGSVTLNRKFALEYNQATNSYVVAASLRLGARTGNVGCSFPGFVSESFCGEFFESPPFGLSGSFDSSTFTGQLIYTDYNPGSNCGCDSFPVSIIRFRSELCWLCDSTRQEDIFLTDKGSYLLSHGEVTQSSPQIWLSKNPLP
jgi:hypothetical protein